MWLLYIFGIVLVIGCINECYEKIKEIEYRIYRIEKNIQELVGEDK